MNIEPKAIIPHVTPQMIADARRCLGSCNLAKEKIMLFEDLGYPLPDQKQLVDAMAKKAEGLLAYADQISNLGLGRTDNGQSR